MLVLCCSFFMTATAQESSDKDFTSIKPGSKINFVMDFSQSIIMGMKEADFSNYELDWHKDQPTIIKKFQNGINKKLDGILNIGNYPDSPYTLKVTVINISNVGNITCDANIYDKSGAILLGLKNVSGGSEPPFLPGTKLAKIKIWATLTGRSLGGILKTEYLNQ